MQETKAPGLHETIVCGIIFLVMAEPLVGSVIGLLHYEHSREGVLTNGQV